MAAPVEGCACQLLDNKSDMESRKELRKAGKV